MNSLEARAHWDAVSDHGLDILIALDRDGRIRDINRVVAPFTKEQVIGLPWVTFIPSEKQAWLQAEFGKVITTGRPFSYVLAAVGTHGTVAWYASRLAPVRLGETITGALLITRDITDNKATEAQLVASDRMASVGTLAAGVAHEINNPLAVVIANLDLVLQRTEVSGPPPDPRALIEPLRDAQMAAERVGVIVRDLKLFSRSSDELQGPVDLHAAVESTLRIAASELRHRARVVTDLGEIPLVRANESRLGQVLLNLIINAAHAIPDGHRETNVVRVTTRMTQEGRVAIEVCDSGCGMSPDLQKRIFLPFFTTKTVGEGTGLGLSIAQGIIRSFDGEILVQSEPSRGSTFTVLLHPAIPEAPLAVARAPVREGAATSHPSPGVRRRGQILIVDDEPSVAKALRRVLECEHSVVTETSGERVLSRVRNGERFDVIFSDLMMPNMSGIDLYRALVELDAAQATRVIFITGGAFTTSVRSFLDEVTNTCIGKPFDLSLIRELVGARLS